jgi:hypothetical protein
MPTTSTLLFNVVLNVFQVEIISYAAVKKSHQACAACLSEARKRTELDFSWPQAARISRPRGVLTGEA